MFLQGWKYFPSKERENTDAENRHDAAADAVLDELNDGMRPAARELAKDRMIHKTPIARETRACGLSSYLNKNP